MVDLPVDNHVAVYIDFDNIMMSRYDELHGRNSFKEDKPGRSNASPQIREKLAAARLDIASVLEYASSFGTTTISRAYGNWADSLCRSYAEDLLMASIDLAQLFPMRESKNGADIRLAIDVIDDLARHQHISHVVIVAGDSDYVSLAHRCRRFGKSVVGVGAGGSVHRYLVQACDEFRYYSSLPGIASVTLDDSAPSVDAEARLQPDEVLRRALKVLVEQSTTDMVGAGGLKNFIKRLDPSFNEKSLGFQNFTDFMRRYPDIVTVHATERGIFASDAGTAPRVGDDDSACAPEVALVDESVRELRRWIAVPIESGLGTGGEGRVVTAIRTYWSLVRARAMTTVAAKELVDHLRAGGMHEPQARHAAHHILSAGLVLCGRGDENMVLLPNPEFEALSDFELNGLMRTWAAHRVRNKRYPEPVDPAKVAVALTGEVTAEVVRAVTKALEIPGYAQMCEALGPQFVTPVTLWEVAEALRTVPVSVRLKSRTFFQAEVNHQMRSVDQSLDDEQAIAVHAALSGADVFHDDTKCRCYEHTENVVEAIVRSWGKLLRDANLFDPNNMVQREAFYRMVLEDRARLDWRQWVRGIIQLV
ncbi:NYN domain-containing protein [Rhodococcoides corynebacterioides]|uniref:NYN domain-containing protein n=1 Tax=Rhodococcoides corynebacterioides TaxID=53972 RepID=UPI001470A550|nr:NYN domain-containing protein [Rhodococcus corynebacterioides]